MKSKSEVACFAGRRSLRRASVPSMLMAVLAVAGLWNRAYVEADEPSSDPSTPLAMFSKFPDAVPCVAFSPDGHRLAAGSYGLVKLFDVDQLKESAALEEPAGFVRALAFSPTGPWLASGSYQTVAIWDVSSNKLLRRLKGHRGYVNGVAFSPDGRLLATASEDETVRLWDADSGELRQTIDGLQQPAQGLAWSRDGQSLAVATGDATRPTKKGSVRIYGRDGSWLRTLEGHQRVVQAVAFSPDGQSCATGSADETIKLWNLADGKELRSLDGHTRPVNSLAYLPDGAGLVGGSGGRNAGGNEIKFWDLASGKERVTIDAHQAAVMQVALSADGRWLASGSADKTVKLWNATALAALPVAESGKKAKGKRPAAVAAVQPAAKADDAKGAAAGELRVGIIGLDTSHSVAFTQLLNDKQGKDHVPGCKVVAAYPQGSPDIPSSTSRVPGYTKDVQALGVEIVPTIEALLEKVDVVLLESNDGRPHLEQVLPVLKAGKKVFIDKPIAGTLADAVAIFEAGKHYKVPLFSSSSLRYAPGAQSARAGKVGPVKGADAYSPCDLEATHPDLFWYGIHGVESLFTVMGTGCEAVSRVSTPGIDVAVGQWKGGRVGTFRGIRKGQGGGTAGYGGTVFGENGIAPLGDYGGYAPLVVEIVKFFQTGTVPVSEEETLEIYAFMEAADESKRQGGAPVKLETVMAKAREAAKRPLEGK